MLIAMGTIQSAMCLIRESDKLFPDMMLLFHIYNTQTLTFFSKNTKLWIKRLFGQRFFPLSYKPCRYSTYLWWHEEIHVGDTDIQKCQFLSGTNTARHLCLSTFYSFINYCSVKVVSSLSWWRWNFFSFFDVDKNCQNSSSFPKK